MTYKSKEELKDKVLKSKDTVIFKTKNSVLNYVVFSNFLASLSNANDIIFKKLGINNKYQFASSCYGYDCNEGIFPSCRKNDYEALTRITLALFEKCEEINNQDQVNNEKELESTKIRTITVVYTNRYLHRSEINNGRLKEYSFLSSCDVLEVGQLIYSPMYTTPMQIISIEDKAELYRNGKQLKHLIIDSINGIDISKFKIESKSENKTETKSEITMNTTEKTPTNKKSMFNNFFEKYKAQFMPEEDSNLKMSIDGSVCVPINDEYVGINKEGNLTSYPEEMCLDFPVYLISKPFSQVKIGDIIRVNKSYMKVLKKTENNTLNCLTFSGYTRNSREIKDFVLGQSLVKVVVNLFENTPFASGNFNPMMMLMLGDKDFDVKDMLMMQMLQGNSDSPQMNSMLMLAMANGNSSSMIETMLMMQMIGNSQFPGFFSSPKVESKKTKKIKTEENSETENQL